MDERDVYKAKEVMQSAMKKVPMRAALIIGAILFIFLLLNPWVQVGPGQRGIAGCPKMFFLFSCFAASFPISLQIYYT